MARVLESEQIPLLGDCPIGFPVCGEDRREAERKIAWLLAQVGVPR